MKTLNWKRMLVIALITFLGLSCWFFMDLRVMGVHLAEEKLSAYAHEHIEPFLTITCEYDVPNDRYVATNDLGFELDYNRGNNAIHDGRMDGEEAQAIQEAYSLIRESYLPEVVLPETIQVWTGVDGDDFSLKKQLIFLPTVYSTRELSEQESLMESSRLIMDVIGQLGDGYRFIGLAMLYGDRNGLFETVVQSTGAEVLTEEAVLKGTRTISEGKWSEEYVAWRAEQGLPGPASFD